jgi:hypothetical protein
MSEDIYSTGIGIRGHPPQLTTRRDCPTAPLERQLHHSLQIQAHITLISKGIALRSANMKARSSSVPSAVYLDPSKRPGTCGMAAGKHIGPILLDNTAFLTIFRVEHQYYLLTVSI